MSCETHRWGESRAADRLWSSVAGLGPKKAGERLLMFLQACIDDSEDHVGGTFVLAGYIAPAENWAKFSAEWEALLETDGVYDEPGGTRYFKMKRFARPSRLPRVEKFYRLIEKHVSVAISCAFNTHDLERALGRLFIPGVEIHYGDIANKYVYAYRMLLDVFHTDKEALADAFPPGTLPVSEKVDFIFDEQKSADKFLNVWNAYMANRPGFYTAHRYGERPVPKDEKEWMPLQAADLWAWWVRKWLSEGRDPVEIFSPDFGLFKQERRDLQKYHFWHTEDDIADSLMRVLCEQLGGTRGGFQPIYDIGCQRGIRGFMRRLPRAHSRRDFMHGGLPIVLPIGHLL